VELLRCSAKIGEVALEPGRSGRKNGRMRSTLVPVAFLLGALLLSGCGEAKKTTLPPSPLPLEKVLKTLLEDPSAFESPDPGIRATGDPVEPFIGAGVNGIDLIRREWPNFCVSDVRNLRAGGPSAVSSRESLARMRLLGTISYVGLRAKRTKGAEAATVSALVEIALTDPNSVLRGHALSTLSLFSVRDREHLRAIAGLLHDDAPSADRGSTVGQVADSVLGGLVTNETRPGMNRESDGPSADRRWNEWLDRNIAYLYFSDGEGNFLLSNEAKSAGVPADPVTGKPIR